MRTEWIGYCRGEGLRVDGDIIEVTFANARRHRVKVEELDGAYRLSSVAVPAKALRNLPDAALEAWQRNRSMLLVGFRVDDRGRVVGEAWVPKVGLDAEEFRLYVRTVALECDRFEFQLTGRDEG